MGIMDLFNQISSGQSNTGPVEYIIVGLGNPGTQYQDTRHNAGFMAIDTMAEKFGADVKRIKFKSLCGECTIAGKKCLLMKPSTYMNNSGEAVVEAMNFYKLDEEHLIVVYDDISLEPSKLRIRRKGSDGGHNGLEHIIETLGSDQFARIRVGIGNDFSQGGQVDYVLGDFTPEQRASLEEMAGQIAEGIRIFAFSGPEMAMNSLNSKRKA